MMVVVVFVVVGGAGVGGDDDGDDLLEICKKSRTGNLTVTDVLIINGTLGTVLISVTKRLEE